MNSAGRETRANIPVRTWQFIGQLCVDRYLSLGLSIFGLIALAPVIKAVCMRDAYVDDIL